MPSVSLAILNYNGRHHLEHLLPTAVNEAGRFGPVCEAVVVDNRSPDNDGRWVRENFPSVRVWTAPKNDHLFSYNPFAAESKSDILVFLNNDLKLQPGFVAPLVRHFSDPDVFAVGATSMDWDAGTFTCGPARLLHENGFYRWPYDCSRQELSHTLFASGGFMAVSRSRFLELGGFDRVYRPAYCEDLDLCFRAWRRGWKCLFEPESIVLHRENGSWGTPASRRVAALVLRNALIFQWSSLPMHRGRGLRALTVAKLLAATLPHGDFRWVSCPLGAWRRIRRAGRSRPSSLQELERLCSQMASLP